MNDIRHFIRNVVDILALKCQDMERAVAAANAFQKAVGDGAGMDEIEAATDLVNDSVVWRAF
jgi:hypothetical protein